ncbi:MAG: hypothetical protein IKU30_00390 [Clostridia bacterium]|nr:hypothetical protein [Clostridia bacterium]
MIESEVQKIKDILIEAEISDRRIKALEPIIENVAWMKIKLDDAREKIATSSVVIPYDNGGGQSGIRENPLYKGYESLWKSYITGMDRILGALPKEAIETVAEDIKTNEPRTVLELVRGKHKKEA